MSIEESKTIMKSFANLDEDIELKQAIETILSELEKKDKIIDEMAWTMTHEDVLMDKYCTKRTMACEQMGGSTYECKDCIKDYFRKKV